MPQFAVVAFPETDALPAIDAVRMRFDPLATMLPAHVTLVFPFDDASAARDLQRHVERVAAAVAPFDVDLAGISIESGDYLFLNVHVGAERIASLHDDLYTGSLAAHLSREHVYRPHITLGRLADPEQLAAAANHAQANLPARSPARITEVAAFRIDGPKVGRVEFVARLSGSPRP